MTSEVLFHSNSRDGKQQPIGNIRKAPVGHSSVRHLSQWTLTKNQDPKADKSVYRHNEIVVFNDSIQSQAYPEYVILYKRLDVVYREYEFNAAIKDGEHYRKRRVFFNSNHGDANATEVTHNLTTWLAQYLTLRPHRGASERYELTSQWALTANVVCPLLKLPHKY